MKSVILTTAVGALFVGPACYGRSSLSTQGAADDGTAHVLLPDAAVADSKNAARSPETESDSSVECESAPRGAELWRYDLGQIDVSVWTSVTVDRRGNAFVSSPPLGTVKIAPDGSREWSSPFGRVVATGRNGRTYAMGTLAHGNGLDSCPASESTDSNVYFAELDDKGNVLRCLSIESVADVDALTGFAVDGYGNVIISGQGLGTTKLDDQGRVLWRQPLSGRVATDSQNNVIVAGAFWGTGVFGDETLESAGGDDVLVAKLSPGGEYLFARRFGDAGLSQRADGVAVDALDDIIVSGIADGSIDFGGGAITPRAEACPDEVWCKQAGFIVKFDASGTHVWSRARFPVRSLRGIATDSHGDVGVSGTFPGNAPPYRLPLLIEFDSAGNDVSRPFHTASALTDAGAGYGLAFDHCDNVLWLVAAPTVPSERAEAFLAKLAP